MALHILGCAKLSSNYKWFSSDMATVSVSAYGVVQAKKPGKAIIKVVSIFDSFNYDEVMSNVTSTNYICFALFDLHHITPMDLVVEVSKGDSL